MVTAQMARIAIATRHELRGARLSRLFMKRFISNMKGGNRNQLCPNRTPTDVNK
jgi:hypothetical protein